MKLRPVRDLAIKNKLKLLIMLTCGVALVLACSSFVVLEYFFFRQKMVEDLAALAEVIADNIPSALLFLDEAAARETLNTLASKPNVAGASVYRVNGDVFVTYARADIAGSFVPPPVGNFGHLFEKDGLALFHPIVWEGETIGTVYLRSSLDELGARLKRYSLVITLVLLGSFLAGGLVSSWLSSWITDPIQHLLSTTRAITQRRDYSVRAVKHGSDEVGLLTEAYNEMLAEIQIRDRALQEARDELERRVDERTRELRQEIVERRRAEQALVQSEEQLRQSQKMEAVGRLAGGVAHDFNNILTIIKFSTELGLAKLGPDHHLREPFEEIQKAGERAANLTHQLLVFGRRQVVRPRVVDLNRIIKDIEGMIRRLIGEDLELCLGLSSEPLPVEADPNQLQQVLLNLAINSRDAMPRGGTITIETAHLADRTSPPSSPDLSGGWVKLTFSDTGVGMNKEILSHVFEPFFTTKEVGKGTGLGLATVYGIVQQSNGTISVRSEPDRGASFEILLPRAQGPICQVEPTEPWNWTPGGLETVLLVEDEPDVRTMAGRVLRNQGYRVLEAPNGEEALDIAGRYRGTIALVISDVVMPRMSGSELVERLLASRPYLNVLFISGYANDTTHHRLISEGAALLRKPFDPQTLLARVRQMLDQRTIRESSAAGTSFEGSSR